MFNGSIPAVVTPFIDDNVDYNSLVKVLNHLIDSGSHGLVPCGTTGESPTLSHDEHKKIIEETIRIADKRVPVIAGTGSNNTVEAIEFTNHAEKSGADGALVVAGGISAATTVTGKVGASAATGGTVTGVFTYTVVDNGAES